MRKKIKIKGLLLCIFAVLAINSCIVTEPVYPQSSAMVSFQVFYDELSPYGRWVDYPGYGFAWVPAGYPGFYPYVTGGYWAYTSYGWTWVSHYSWGWAPFHYGRWFFDVVLGWIWIPGTDWGPAWVVWAHAPGYYGFIPMYPGYGYHIHSYPVEYWTFVPENDFGKSGVYYGPRSSNSTLVKNAKVIENKGTEKERNSTYYTGPRIDEVQKTTGRQIKPVSVQEIDKPAQSLSNNQLRIYRPQVKKQDSAEKQEAPAPKRITRIEDFEPDKKIEREEKQPEIQTTPKDKTDVRQEMPEINKDLPVTIPGKKRRSDMPVEREKPIPLPERKQKVQPFPKEKEYKAPGQMPQVKEREQAQPQPKPQNQERDQQIEQKDRQQQPGQRPQTKEPRQSTKDQGTPPARKKEAPGTRKR